MRGRESPTTGSSTSSIVCSKCIAKSRDRARRDGTGAMWPSRRSAPGRASRRSRRRPGASVSLTCCHRRVSEARREQPRAEPPPMTSPFVQARRTHKSLHEPHLPLILVPDPRDQQAATPARPTEEERMKRRTMIGMFGVLGAGLLAGAAGFAYAHHGGREAMMKRFISSAIDDALAPAQPTPDQRAAVYAARDRAFAAVEQMRQGRAARMEEALQLFEADSVDPSRLQAFRQRAAEEHERAREAISQAVMDAHDVLTPAQRKLVADYVRNHHPHHAP
ncbi:MAG: hypothetical protein C5B48_13405 [Candidatus Rokuibacteriota bacterium]|nr:MAG: hypothetical protein C5B48_13405 [Candidatus Rokubacteria bacterium]